MSVRAAGGAIARRLPAPARHALRAVRKGTKRLRARGLSVAMDLRNRCSRRPVTGDAPVVVSLTSYGPRIGTVARAIESIGRGRARPRELILWLDDAGALANPPRALRRLQRRGLSIRPSDNLGPHTKYYPYLESVPAQDRLPLVTADDDILYPVRWLEGLVRAHREHQDAVNCHWASVVGVRDGRIAPYASWARARNTAAALNHFATGVSGVIYPPRMLEALEARGRDFRTAAPSTDDIWLHWVALQHRIPIRQVSPRARHFPILPGSQKHTLLASNVAGHGNDEVFGRLYTGQDIALLNGPPEENAGNGIGAWESTGQGNDLVRR